MKLRTFRAASMHEALAMVCRELGPDAAVLHTREVRNRWLSWLPGPGQIEVTASRGVNVPSRLPARSSGNSYRREKPPHCNGGAFGAPRTLTSWIRDREPRRAREKSLLSVRALAR